MATPNSRRNFSKPHKDVDDNAESPFDSPFGPAAADNATPTRQRLSLSGRLPKPSRDSPWRRIVDEELGSPAALERPPIPSALAPTDETLSSPLPVLPMIVLSIVMLGEFLSANVSTPFLLPMVKGFGNFNDEADVGFWTGILVSCFFITQFLTSLLWATISEKHGIRTVMFVSLLGSSLTCLSFGTSTTLPQAMTIRLLQGVFAGAIGVGRGNVVTITNPSNEGRAYAILGFCWGFGGVAGAIIGGAFETPAGKWPGVFGKVALFVKYPYLLPTMIAASITFTGAMLSLFLAHDGGPREGAIRLPVEKTSGIDTIPEETTILEEEGPSGVVNRLKHSVSRKFSGYFSKGNHEESPGSGGGTPPVPLSTSVRRTSNNRLRTFSRTSPADGSAYGYSSGYRKRVASVSQSLAGRRGSLASTVARRRMSNIHGPGGDRRESRVEEGELNFAQRLLMANENVVTNIADLWVAAAINADNDDVFLSESELEEDEDPFHDDEEDEGGMLDVESPSRPGRSSTSALSPRSLGVSPPARQGRLSSITHRPSTSGPRTQLGSPRRPSHRPSMAQVAGDTLERRVSSTVPAIFSHTGLRSPGALERPDPLGHFTAGPDSEEAHGEGLMPIYEGRSQSTPEPQQARREVQADHIEEVAQPQPSLFSQLPIAVIIQYGLLALHSTTHDQVFLSYLVSKYSSGGLNLNPGHFAQLIALLSLASIAYQFYLYPNMGPPRGRFSHLAMFRIGSLLFIPAYLTVTLYRPLASPDDDGNPILMAALVFSTAMRFAGITFSYTAVAILLNYMTPPHLLGYANGIAQSIVSFARFVGPILGGYLWSVSVDGNPSGYPLGFFVCAGVTSLAVGHSFFIR